MTEVTRMRWLVFQKKEIKIMMNEYKKMSSEELIQAAGGLRCHPGAKALPKRFCEDRKICIIEPDILSVSRCTFAETALKQGVDPAWTPGGY